MSDPILKSISMNCCCSGQKQKRLYGVDVSENCVWSWIDVDDGNDSSANFRDVLDRPLIEKVSAPTWTRVLKSATSRAVEGERDQNMLLHIWSWVVDGLTSMTSIFGFWASSVNARP